MNDKNFFDTNVIVYLYSEDEKRKKNISQKIVNTCALPTISSQVVNELISVLSKKFKLDWGEIEQVLNEITNSFSIELVRMFDIQIACEIAKRYKYSYFDSLMLASALSCDASIIYSEDMQHSQIIENKLKIINPFLKSSLDSQIGLSDIR